LGVAGAGLASTIAVAIGVAMMWIYFHRYEHYVAIDSALWRPQLAQWKRILGIGLPAGGEFAIIFLNLRCGISAPRLRRASALVRACWASFICRGYRLPWRLVPSPDRILALVTVSV
jgi:hypothetical protein